VDRVEGQSGLALVGNISRDVSAEEIVRQVSSWVSVHWDPEMTLNEWWGLLAKERLSVPHWPQEWFGRGWSRGQSLTVMATLRMLKVPGPPAGVGIMLAGPTILQHGTAEQKERLLPDIISGAINWCQLFSEPGAGSDLASISTRATRTDNGWSVNGQKVWTSNGHLADVGMLLARTSESAGRHRNLTWFVVDMEQPGIQVRLLREMTGRSLFTEVFMDDAQAFDHDIIGDVNDGWHVARTTLINERLGLGGGGGAVGGVPGTRGGQIHGRAGDAVRPVNRTTGTALAMRGRAYAELLDVARLNGVTSDTFVRERLTRLYALERVSQLTQQRVQDEGSKGRTAPAGGSLAKLLGTRSTQMARDLGMTIVGSQGMLWTGDRSQAETAQELFLFSPAVSIYGGTDQIQKNILAERILGLPR
jgi:alkylation response protein AidB-like acyl-CoA dehydrogenase